MGRKVNDGRGRIGGRKKGTPNKPKASCEIWLTNMLDSQRAQFEQDLNNCTPHERLDVMVKVARVVLEQAERNNANRLDNIAKDGKILAQQLAQSAERQGMPV